MSEGLQKISLEHQKHQISRILDLEPNVELQNAAQTSVLILNSAGVGGGSLLDLPTNSDMTKDNYEMVDVRRRNWSNSSCDSADVAYIKPLFGNKEIIYYDLEDGDTLQKLALKFNCNTSEIKHANKIYNEKEIHVLRTLKIPVVKDGLIHEEYLRQKNAPSSEQLIDVGVTNDGFYGDRKDRLRVQGQHEINPDLDFLPSSDEEDYEVFDRKTSQKKPLLLPCDQETRTILLGQPIDRAEPTLADFIERVDLRIQHEIKGVNSQKEDMDKVVGALLSPVVFPSCQKSKPEKYGSACYFSWKFFLVLLCLIAVVVPLLYGLHYVYNRNKAS